MKTSTVIAPEEKERLDDAPRGIEQGTGSRAHLLETWLFSHLNVLAAATVAAGFALRVFVAGQSYLNPDEALHYLLLNQPSMFRAYQASLTNAHPPLIYLVVYVWYFFGRSELMLRLPSAVAGTVFCWVFYKWTAMVFGRAASWIGLILATFLPATVVLSAELRAYALLLCFVASSLCFLERAFADTSVRKMWCFSLFLYLAILSHYSAVFFTLSVGAYALARIADSRPPRKIVFAWIEGQAGALAIYVFLYVTHVSKITQNALATWKSPFDRSFFRPGHQSLLAFTGLQTSDIFAFLFEHPYLSPAMLLFFGIGVVLIFFQDFTSRERTSRPRHLGVLLLLPFIAVWLAGVAGKYPYTGGRHTIFLAPLIISGVSYLIASAIGERFWPAVLLAGLIVGGAYTSGKIYEPYIKPENQSRMLMMTAMEHIRQSVPRSDLILADYQSSLLLGYYLCGPNVVSVPIGIFPGGDFDLRCDGYTIAAQNTYRLEEQGFPSLFEKMARSRGLKPGDPVWVFQSGWLANLNTELPWFNMKFRCLQPASFGENIAVIPFVVGADMAPALPPGSPHLTRLKRCSDQN